jgi:hypothetical protein
MGRSVLSYVFLVANSQYQLAVAGGCEANHPIQTEMTSCCCLDECDSQRGLGFAPTRYREVVLTVRHNIGGTDCLPLRSNLSRLHILQHFACGIRAVQSCDATARMRARAAQIESAQRRPVLGPSKQRSEGEELIERLLTVVDVSARQPIRLFEIDWRQYLFRENQLAEAGCVLLNLIENCCRKVFALRIPVGALQFIRSKLNVNAHHVLSFGCE